MTNLLKHSMSKISLEFGENTRDITSFATSAILGTEEGTCKSSKTFFPTNVAPPWLLFQIFLLLIKFWIPIHQNFRFLPWFLTGIHEEGQLFNYLCRFLHLPEAVTEVFFQELENEIPGKTGWQIMLENHLSWFPSRIFILAFFFPLGKKTGLWKKKKRNEKKCTVLYCLSIHADFFILN